MPFFFMHVTEKMKLFRSACRLVTVRIKRIKSFSQVMREKEANEESSFSDEEEELFDSLTQIPHPSEESDSDTIFMQVQYLHTWA